METTAIARPSIRKYNDLGKTEIMFQLSKQPGQSFPFYPPTEIVPAQSEVLFIPEKLDSKGQPTGEGDMDKATNRLIAYLPGMRSIYVDEWSDKEKENLKKLKSIKFINGFKTISTREKTLLEYLRTAGYNQANNATRIGSTTIYREVSYEDEAKKVVDKDNKMINAQYFVNNNPIDEVRAYAEVLCKTQAEVESVRTAGENTVRYNLKELAKTNPELFISGLTDPAMKNRLFIVRALQRDIIGIDDKETELFWNTNKEVFVQAPSGMSVIHYFADLSSKNDKYGKMVESIKELLNEEPKKEKSDWVTVFIENAIEKGAIITSGNWHLIPGETEDDEPILKYNGINKLRDAIKGSKDNIMEIVNNKMEDAE